MLARKHTCAKDHTHYIPSRYCSLLAEQEHCTDILPFHISVVISKWPHHALTCLCCWPPSATPSHHTAVPGLGVDHVLDLFSSETTNSVVERWVCFTDMMCVACNYSLWLHYICNIIRGTTGVQCTANCTTLQGSAAVELSVVAVIRFLS